MTNLKLGILLWSQVGTWPDMLDAARRVDRLGYEHLWTWDHINAIYGDWDQPILEGWSLLSAWAMATERVRLGLLVGANTFRNPGIQAKNATTLDHVSGGRAILGLGGAWFDVEHTAHGIDFGTGFGQRLDWMDESAGVMRRLLDGEVVTSDPGGHYHFDGAHQLPLPVQARLPIMIGGGGEKKTLRTVAKYADMWNGFGDAATLKHKDEVLRAHCEAVGRDEREIERSVGCKIVIRDTEAAAQRVWAEQMANNTVERADWDDADTAWIGTPEQIVDEIRSRVAVGVETVIVELPAPYDVETIERLMGEVKPLVDAG
jgi:alkanesulfonate monooxygenase SsuD/methylene tetrahydromethanopterin reductase-like flavin-dependent oxidoreductase (luciferase family)